MPDPAVGWWVETVATISASLDQVNAALSGSMPVDGIVDADLRKLTASMVGNQPFTGDIDATLRPALVNMAGGMIPKGDIAAFLQHALFSGSVENQGNLGSVIIPARASLAGSQTQQGVAAAILKKAIANMVGQQPYQGNIAAAVRSLQAAFSGSQTQQGAVAAVNKAVSAAMGGTAQVPAVLFQALTTPSGTFNSFNPGLNRTISHSATGAAGECGVVIMVGYASNGLGGFATRNMTWGGVTVPELSFSFVSSYAVTIGALIGPLTGPQNVFGEITGGGNAGRELWVGCATYTGVASVIGNFIAATNTIAVPSADGDRLVNAMGSASAISGYNQTVRAGPSTISIMKAIWGDAPGDVGGADVTFTAVNGGRTAAIRLRP